MLNRVLCLTLVAAVPAFGDAARIESTLPEDPPASVVVFEQCGATLGFYGTMPDGTLLAFDMSSPVTVDDLLAWASKAQRAIVVEAKCAVVIEPGKEDART